MKPKTTTYDSREYKKICSLMRERMRMLDYEYRIYHLFDQQSTYVNGVPYNKVNVTICVAHKRGAELYVRGISIRSQYDNDCRAVGIKYAMQRALGALKNGEQKLIKRQDARDQIIRSNFGDYFPTTILYPLLKQECWVDLTPFEKRLFGIVDKEASEKRGSTYQSVSER